MRTIYLLSKYFTVLSKYLQNRIQILYNFNTFKRRLLEVKNAGRRSGDHKKRIPYRKHINRVQRFTSAHKVLFYGHS